MQIFKVALLLLLMFCGLQKTVAKEIIDLNSIEINELIEKVKTAPPEEKYKYMNLLKLKLRALNIQERKKAIRKVMESLRHERHEHRESEYHSEHMNEEKIMEREHEIEERREEIKDRTNFRYIEQEEREHDYEERFYKNDSKSEIEERPGVEIEGNFREGRNNHRRDD